MGKIISCTCKRLLFIRVLHQKLIVSAWNHLFDDMPPCTFLICPTKDFLVRNVFVHTVHWVLCNILLALDDMASTAYKKDQSLNSILMEFLDKYWWLLEHSLLPTATGTTRIIYGRNSIESSLLSSPVSGILCQWNSQSHWSVPSPLPFLGLEHHGLDSKSA